MEERIREQCIYCGGEIVYSALEKYVKCRYCGKTFSVLKFRSEQAKIKRALEEGEKAKAALAEAEARRQEAQDRLNQAVDDLTGLREGQDTLSRLMQALADTQTQSDEKLALLQNVAARLLETQDDVLAKLDVQKEIVSMLHGLELDAEERRRLEADFIAWSQAIREEDRERLERIQDDASKLLSGQDALNERVNVLRHEVEQNGKALAAFRGEYQSDKVKALEQLYRQAEGFQRERRFAEAAEAYREMLVKGGADVEILWRLVMCRYCLEYQKDENGRLIPIILCPDLTDPIEIAERRELLAHIKPDEAFYREELTRIDAILDKYREVRHKVHYDVFISVKQNVDGHHTPDSDVASDLYDYIKRKGLRVFNSRRTPIPAGQEYEPYIISALMSAKVLIVVGTKPEYMNAQWVRNEWSRFQWLQRSEEERSGHTDRVLFCYLVGGMSPKKIPKALNPDREAIIDGVNATERLDVALAFLLPNPSPEPVSTPKPRLADDMSLDGVLKQMTTWLHNGQFDQVARRYNELTDRNRFLNSAKIHLYALCAKKHVHDVENLVHSRTRLEDESLFQLARKLCDNEGERAWLEDLAARNREYRKGKLNRKRRAWIAAVSAALLAITGVVYFAFLRPTSKSAITPEPTELITTEPTEEPTQISTAVPTDEPALEPTPEPTEEPKRKMESEVSFLSATPQVIAIVPFGESFTYTTQVKSDGSARLEASDEPFETVSFTQTMKSFSRPSEFAEKYTNIYKLQSNEAGAGFELILNDYTGQTPIVPQNIVNFEFRSESGDTTERGYQLMDAEMGGNYNVALTTNVPQVLYKRYEYSTDREEMAYLVVTTYNDGVAQQILFQLESDEAEQAPELLMQQFDVGSIIEFGHYEQDNDTSNGAEAIEWIVLENDGETATLISKYGLDAVFYNTEQVDITWETCTLRKWLNDDFLNAAFTTQEQAMLETVTVTADKNPEFDTDPGNDTWDKVFLLSIDEVDKYFTSDNALICTPTETAVENGICTWRDTFDTDTCWWWLRTPGYEPDHAADVYYVGYLDCNGALVNNEGSVDGSGEYTGPGAVRPVVVLRLKDLNSGETNNSGEDTASTTPATEPTPLPAGSAAQPMSTIPNTPENATEYGKQGITDCYVSEPDVNMLMVVTGYGYVDTEYFDGASAKSWLIITNVSSGQRVAYPLSFVDGVSGLSHEDAVCQNPASCDFQVTLDVSQYREGVYSLALVIGYKRVDSGEIEFAYLPFDGGISFTVLDGRIITPINTDPSE